ncbi:MAG: metallophosphoesterase [candidate division Zixibacteria bacterium]|nr:metallophosphoesterase [candidate division Zixibacteria bacterium]
MRLAWLTDIHLNFLSPQELDVVIPALRRREADVYLVTGDIGEADSLSDYLERLAQEFDKPVYYVLGNHDYYRGSIESVREKMLQLSLRLPALCFLTQAGIQKLTDSTCLIGHDGWPDGRFGDFENSQVLLNDFLLIRDFRRPSSNLNRLDPEVKYYWLSVMQRLADESARSIDRLLKHALAEYPKVLVATHVPPFREASLFNGKISHDHFQPFFASRVMGEILLSHADANPNAAITVYCGHTHGAGEFSPMPNLRVVVGGAEYGRPEVQRLIEI